MSEIESNPNQPLFNITPNKLSFSLDTDNILLLSQGTEKISKEIEIKINNLSSEFIIIKIKTTKKNNYIMTPSSFILSPKEENMIKIRFKRDEGEKLELKSHKIQFEGCIISQEDKDLNVDDLYKKYIKNGNKDVNNIIAKTYFFDKNGNNLSSLTSINISNINNTEIKDFNLGDLNKVNNRDIIFALILALIVGFGGSYVFCSPPDCSGTG